MHETSKQLSSVYDNKQIIERELATLKIDLDTKDRDETAQVEVAKLKSEKRRLHASHSDLNTISDNLGKKLADSLSQNKMLTGDLDFAVRRYESLKSRHDALLSEYNKLDAKNKTDCQRVTELERENERLQRELGCYPLMSLEEAKRRQEVYKAGILEAQYAAIKSASTSFSGNHIKPAWGR